MSEITTVELMIYSLIGLAASTLSGVAGGGGGFIMTPLLIFLGLSPAAAVSTGKLSGLSVSIGSLHGFKTEKIKNKKFVILTMAIALVIGLLAPFFIKHLADEFYQRALGLLIIFMIPIVKTRQFGLNSFDPSRRHRVLGWALLVVSLLLQAVFSGGMGVLVLIVLMSLLGMDSITAQITKRWSQVLLNTVIVLGVVSSGLIVWPVAFAGILTSFIGGRLGAKLALKRGNQFVMDVFMVLMFLSGIGLLLS